MSDGPNKDVKWLQDVHDTSVIDWGMHPEIEDSLSAFTAANCGTLPVGSQVCSPTPTLGNGFMLASTFRDQIARHEVGSSNSHYADYVTEINKPSLNFRPNLEGVVGPPSLPLLVPEPGQAATFKNNVKVTVLQLSNAWYQEYVKHSEPCSAQCDGSCSNYIGDWNTRNASGVYPACPVPAPFGVPPFTSIGDQPFASKGRVQ